MGTLMLHQIKAQCVLNDIPWVSGQVEIPLWKIIEGNYDGFYDLLSTQLIGSDLLMDIGYSLVGVNSENETLIFSVEGDPSAHLEIYDKEEGA